MAIGIKVTKGVTDEGVSKFFGSPAIPGKWSDSFGDDVIFFCQIRLEDIAALDKENKLPHKGYLYIFLDTADYPYTPIVKLYDGEPDTVIDDFNDIGDEFSQFTEAWEMSFSETDDENSDTRLLGRPYDWNYPDPAPQLLMQYDTIMTEMKFMDTLDGFVYFFFGKERDLSDVTMHLEYT